MATEYEHLRELCRAKNFKAALAEIEKLEKTPKPSPRLLVLKANCIQLSDGDRYSLEDVESAFRMAIEADDEYVDAYIERAWFMYSIEDRADQAQKMFTTALHLLKKLNLQVIRGLLACAEELKDQKDLKALKDDLRNQLLSADEPAASE